MMSSTAIQKMDLKDIGNILDILSEAKKIYTMGNGGSAATALHLALDLRKAAGLNAVCLNGNMPLISAYANDDGYESVFASQLENAERFDADGNIVGECDNGEIINPSDEANPH